MERFFKIKTFKSLKKVMESFFNCKNFKSLKIVMESFFGMKNFKSRKKCDGVLFSVLKTLRVVR